MTWHIWVIIALSIVLLSVIVSFAVTVRRGAKAVEKAFLAPWLKGNFGKRDR